MDPSTVNAEMSTPCPLREGLAAVRCEARSQYEWAELYGEILRHQLWFSPHFTGTLPSNHTPGKSKSVLMKGKGK